GAERAVAQQARPHALVVDLDVPRPRPADLDVGLGEQVAEQILGAPGIEAGQELPGSGGDHGHAPVRRTRSRRRRAGSGVPENIQAKPRAIAAEPTPLPAPLGRAGSLPDGVAGGVPGGADELATDAPSGEGLSAEAPGRPVRRRSRSRSFPTAAIPAWTRR